MDDIEKEFFSLLTAFHQHGVLSHLVLIGSWALKIYEEHFKTKHLPFKTTDVDFSVKNPRQITLHVSPSIHSKICLVKFAWHLYLFLRNASRMEATAS